MINVCGDSRIKTGDVGRCRSALCGRPANVTRLTIADEVPSETEFLVALAALTAICSGLRNARQCHAGDQVASRHPSFWREEWVRQGGNGFASRLRSDADAREIALDMDGGNRAMTPLVRDDPIADLNFVYPLTIAGTEEYHAPIIYRLAVLRRHVNNQLFVRAERDVREMGTNQAKVRPVPRKLWRHLFQPFRVREATRLVRVRKILPRHQQRSERVCVCSQWTPPVPG